MAKNKFKKKKKNLFYKDLDRHRTCMQVAATFSCNFFAHHAPFVLAYHRIGQNRFELSARLKSILAHNWSSVNSVQDLFFSPLFSLCFSFAQRQQIWPPLLEQALLSTFPLRRSGMLFESSTSLLASSPQSSTPNCWVRKFATQM